MVPITIMADVKGERNKLIVREVEAAARRFLDADLQAIEDACNRRRKEFLDRGDDDIRAELAAKLRPPPTVEKVRQEATPEFRLKPPEDLVIEFLRGSGPNRTSMVCLWGDTPHPKIGVFLGRIVNRSRPVAEIMYHEMLHACGDYDRSVDGVVRMDWIGVAAVKEVLGE